MKLITKRRSARFHGLGEEMMWEFEVIVYRKVLGIFRARVGIPPQTFRVSETDLVKYPTMLKREFLQWEKTALSRAKVYLRNLYCASEIVVRAEMDRTRGTDE